MKTAVSSRPLRILRWISPFTWCCLAASFVFAVLLASPIAETPNTTFPDYFQALLIILSGPVAKFAAFTGIEGFFPPRDDWVVAIVEGLVFLMLCSGLILAHSWRRNIYTAVVTIVGFGLWLLIGMTLTYYYV